MAVETQTLQRRKTVFEPMDLVYVETRGVNEHHSYPFTAVWLGEFSAGIKLGPIASVFSGPSGYSGMVLLPWPAVAYLENLEHLTPDVEGLRFYSTPGNNSFTISQDEIDYAREIFR